MTKVTNVSWLVTGSMSALSIPGLIFSLRSSHPNLNFTPYLTQSASRIVTMTSMATLSGVTPRNSDWGSEPEATPSHIQIESESDAYLIAPATLDFLARFARYDCSTPFSLALQCTKKPILVAPSLPPGGKDSIAYKSLSMDLLKWENLRLLSPIETKSASSPNASSSGFGSATRLIEFMLENLQGT